MRWASLAAAAVSLAAGCAVNYPQTAQEFREQVPGATFGQKRSFEANRPFREVAKTFQARAPQCLSVRVRTVSRTSTSYQNILETYKPTVRLSADRAEIHVQRSYQGGGVIVPGKVPEGGLYLVVADATPIGRNRTRVDIYGPTRGADAIIRAISGWATGENVGGVSGALHVHRVDAQCRTEYLGTVKLDRPALALALPPGQARYLVVAFDTSSLLGGSRSTSAGTFVVPRPGRRYELAVRYRDSVYDVSLSESDGRTRRALPHREPEGCRGTG